MEETMGMDRFWSPSMGMGTLTWMESPDVHACRFTPDEGPLRDWRWSEAKYGKPGLKMPRKGDILASEWGQWQTFVTKDGETIVLRRNGPPPA